MITISVCMIAHCALQLAVYAEFRQDWRAAVSEYQAAYNHVRAAISPPVAAAAGAGAATGGLHASHSMPHVPLAAGDPSSGGGGGADEGARHGAHHPAHHQPHHAHHGSIGGGLNLLPANSLAHKQSQVGVRCDGSRLCVMCDPSSCD